MFSRSQNQPKPILLCCFRKVAQEASNGLNTSNMSPIAKDESLDLDKFDLKEKVKSTKSEDPKEKDANDSSEKKTKKINQVGENNSVLTLTSKIC